MKELSLHLLDLIENSAAAGATKITLHLLEDHPRDRLVLTICDNGRGMTPEVAQTVTDAFTTTRTTRKVGLGLPLLAAAAEQAGGSFTVKSKPGLGTIIKAAFQLSHLDRAPLGKLEDTFVTAALLHPDIHLTLLHRVGRRHYRLSLEPAAGAMRDVTKTHRWSSHLRRGRHRLGSRA
jgi:signal transduction histidine kinase